MKKALLFVGLASFVLVGCKTTTPEVAPIETQESMESVEGAPVDETMQVEPVVGEEGDPVPVEQDPAMGAPAAEY